MPSKPEFIKVQEQDREYIYPDGQRLTVGNVVEIAVSASGHHRLTTAHENNKYIIAPGWRAIRFKADSWSF